MTKEQFARIYPTAIQTRDLRYEKMYHWRCPGEDDGRAWWLIVLIRSIDSGRGSNGRALGEVCIFPLEGIRKGGKRGPGDGGR